MAINRNKVLDAAQKHQRKGNFDKAIREYHKLVEDDPGDTRSLLKLADLYTKVGKMGDALESYKSVAYHYLNDDIYDKAVAIFKQAIRLNDQDPTLHRDLGEAYHRMGRLKEAVAQYNLAQKIYSNLGDVNSQRDILERMVRLEPEDPALRIKLAEHYTRANMRDEAVGLFRYAAQQFEEDGRFDDQIKVLERILYLNPSNSELRMKVVRHYDGLNNHKASLKHLQTLFKDNPTDVETLQLLSRTFDQLGESKKASLVYLELARIYKSQGDEMRSRGSYQHVLRLDPSNKEARAELAPPQAQRPAQGRRDDRLDSDSIPGLSETGNLGGNRGAVHQSHQEPPQPEELPDIEFLDDDLEDVLAPQARVPQPVAPQRQQQRPPQQPQPPRPQPPQPQPRNAPPQPQNNLGNDLVDFTEGAFDDLGDINLDNLQQYPTMAAIQPPQPEEVPIIEIEPLPLDLDEIEIEPEIAPLEDNSAVKQALDEAKVFMKYGLRDKAVQTLLDLTKTYPTHIPVREELAKIYSDRGDRILAADQHIEIAKLLAATPNRATEHLDRAAELFGDRDRVAQIAAGLGLAYGAVGGEATFDDLANIAIELDEGDLLDEGPITGNASFGNGLQQDALRHSGGAGLNLATDDILTDDALELDDSDLIELDDGLMAEETDVSMNALKVGPRSNFSKPSAGDNMGFGLTEAEADAMFDDLFGDVGSSAVSMSFGGSQDLAGVAEVDFLIEQGMVSEAEAALDSLARQNPSSATIDRRRLSLDKMRSDRSNPFGSRSLSGAFSLAIDDPLSEPIEGLESADDAPSLMNLSSATNTNVELGASYMELGLYDEAIEEFRLALDDPGVSSVALYNIASCELKLGNPDRAVQSLTRLLQDRNAPEDIRRAASVLLQRVR